MSPTHYMFSIYSKTSYTRHVIIHCDDFRRLHFLNTESVLKTYKKKKIAKLISQEWFEGIEWILSQLVDTVYEVIFNEICKSKFPQSIALVTIEMPW